MKIGIDARMYGRQQTGIGTYIKCLTDYLFKIDDKNEYVLFLLEPEFSRFKPPTPRVKKQKVTSHWYSWREQLKFPLELSKVKVDLMHFPHFNSPIFYPQKSIVTIHDITPRFFPGHKMGSLIRRTGFRIVFNSTVKKARLIITPSQATKGDLIKYFKVPAKKIRVIYEGTEPDFRVIKNHGKIEKLKEKYGLAKPFILYVGVWRNHKNIVGLIKAFDILLKKYKGDYQLVIAGKEDSYYPEIKKIHQQLGLKDRIIYPGFVPDKELPLIYNAASLFALPSFYEGFGLVALEAMACGTPVVSSKTASLPEVLGSAAIFFDPKNPEEMAEVLARVLKDNNLQKDLIIKGLERAEKYSWSQMAKETLKIYEEAGRDKL